MHSSVWGKSNRNFPILFAFFPLSASKNPYLPRIRTHGLPTDERGRAWEQVCTTVSRWVTRVAGVCLLGWASACPIGCGDVRAWIYLPIWMCGGAPPAWVCLDQPPGFPPRKQLGCQPRSYVRNRACRIRDKHLTFTSTSPNINVFLGSYQSSLRILC